MSWKSAEACDLNRETDVIPNTQVKTKTSLSSDNKEEQTAYDSHETVVGPYVMLLLTDEWGQVVSGSFA